ncbi:cupin domain-containing protein [Sorangium sp. So ce145]|uniref:cupin domain-containing protein n=1 Tax=Sorangium sp. So ce145 TaxID=3133285 RepID=UPI003F5E5AE4
MTTLKITPEQMRSRIARFGELRAYVNHTVDTSIPQEAFDAVNPPLYLLMAPAAGDAREGTGPAIVGSKGMSVGIVSCRPGDKVPLHAHRRSREVFLCLTGRFALRWNEGAMDETTLEPFDMIDVPVGVYRQFENVGQEPGLLLAIITDEHEDEPGDIVIAPEDRARFAERFGPAILEKLTATTGMLFTDPPTE